MGYRFRLEEANVLAWMLSDETYRRGSEYEDANDVSARAALEAFLQGSRGQFLSSRRMEAQYRELIEMTRHLLHQRDGTRWAITLLRVFFASRPWTALVVPSGNHHPSDVQLCSYEFLREIVDVAPEDPGLILQLQEAPGETLDLSSPFPAFKRAVALSHDWPGLLVWNGTHNDFLSFADAIDPARAIRECLVDLSYLGRDRPVRGSHYEDDWFRHVLRQLRERYKRSTTRSFHILQLSDLHFGSPEADVRRKRLNGLVEELGGTYGTGANTLPVISGDIVDEPTEANAVIADEFRTSLDTKFENPHLFIRGNHDCRKQGWKRTNKSFDALRGGNSIRRFDLHGVCVVGFDSCEDGDLATGHISGASLDGLGNDLARDRQQEFVRIGVVHHHPLPVPIPDWLKHRGIWKFLTPAHEQTVAFQNSRSFLDFLEVHEFRAVLHGHKHIPRLSSTPRGVPVFGAGSATGMIETEQGRRVISANVVTVSTRTSQVSCRFHLEDTYGGGQAYEREYVVRG